MSRTLPPQCLRPWASRYIDDPTGRASSAGLSDPRAAGYVEVSESGDGALGQTITAGRHIFPADEPAPIGTDSGPDPYDLLLAALGTSTAMTVWMYAQRNRWPLRHLTVHLRHSRIHASDCAGCATQVGKLDRIERILLLEGELDDDQSCQLLEIADKCPVQRTLGSAVIIDSDKA